MKNEREDRKRTYSQMLDRSKNVVADELLFTATNKFFENMNEEDIKLWVNTCMDFVYNDLGYKKEQVLHATIHMDEKTPHIHCVVVPLIKKLNKRTNTERYTISKKQYPSASACSSSSGAGHGIFRFFAIGIFGHKLKIVCKCSVISRAVLSRPF